MGAFVATVGYLPRCSLSFLLRDRSPILFRVMSNEPSLIKAQKRRFPWWPCTLQLGHENKLSSLKEKC